MTGVIPQYFDNLTHPPFLMSSNSKSGVLFPLYKPLIAGIGNKF
jgi:hypothetical protein